MTTSQERYQLRAFWAAMTGAHEQLGAALDLLPADELEQIATAGERLSRAAGARWPRTRYRELNPLSGQPMVDAPPLPDRE